MMHVGNHLRLLAESEKMLAVNFSAVAARHHDQPDVPAILCTFEGWSREHVRLLEPIVGRFPGMPALSPHILANVLFKGQRKGGLGLLRDFQDLHLLAGDVHGGWTIAGQVAAALRDEDLLNLCNSLPSQTVRQMEWIETRIKELAPHVLIAV
jgi:hypothetical protein